MLCWPINLLGHITVNFFLWEEIVCQCRSKQTLSSCTHYKKEGHILAWVGMDKIRVNNWTFEICINISWLYFRGVDRGTRALRVLMPWWVDQDILKPMQTIRNNLQNLFKRVLRRQQKIICLQFQMHLIGLRSTLSL